MKKIHYFSPRRAWFRFLCFFVGITLVFLAWIVRFSSWEKENIVLLIDNSLSMTVQDIADENIFLSRLDTAKIISNRIIDDSNFPIAIASFSRYLTLETPLSWDKNLLKNVVSSISPLIYGGGSDIKSAIWEINKIYKDTQNTFVFVLSDAEFLWENTQIENIPKNIKINFIAIGTKKWWYMLQGYNAEWKPRYREYKGEKAISSVDEKNVLSLAKDFSASYFLLDDASKLSQVLQFVKNEIQKIQPNVFLWEIFGFICIFFAIFFSPFPYVKSYEKK